MPGTILVLGSGPGIGIHVSIQFGKNDFDTIILTSRNRERLEEDARKVKDAVKSDKLTVKTVQIDLTDTERLKITLAEILAAHPQLDCVFFNGARVGPSAFFDFSAADLEKDFQITNTALYVAASVLVGRMTQYAAEDGVAKKPSFLVTNSMLYRKPLAEIFSLCVVKAAQRTLVECLYNTYKTEGVHFGLISIEGVVNPDTPHMSPATIAERTWELHCQEEKEWALEVEINEIKK